MITSPHKPGERIVDVEVTDAALVVHLADGRVVSAPLTWYPRLLNATAAQRTRWRIAGAGFGIHWPDIDEDLSIHGILAGVPAAGAHAVS
jgi:hypothetical protein